jgi:hypothetical protein
MGDVDIGQPLTLRNRPTALQKRQPWLTIWRRQQPTTTATNPDGHFNGSNY